jgi:putative transferase (TIGR04331 family)
VQYRPYFDVPGTLKDAPWVLSRFPDVTTCTGPIAPAMLSCRLLVVDHPGTTILEALAAGVPMVLFWSSESWFMTPYSQYMLDCLRTAGIWHDDPRKAARKAAEVFTNPVAWWDSPSVRDARMAYAEIYAMTVAGSEDASWLRTLKTL